MPNLQKPDPVRGPHAPDHAVCAAQQDMPMTHPLVLIQRRVGATVVAALLAACSSPAPYPTHQTIPAVPATSAKASTRNDVALYAMSLLDTRYAWGGRGPAMGFDCSGLVAHVYKEAAGMKLRGSSADLGRLSRPVDTARLQAGDLVFFNTLGARHSHVGVYVGDGRFVHASNERTGVRIDHLNNRYYAKRFEGGQTLLD
jgi:cell wall-associated NlpC family hydrolase